LFEPYERKWAFHKVIIMTMKVLVVLPTSIMVASNQVGHRVDEHAIPRLLLIQSLATIAVLSLYGKSYSHVNNFIIVMFCSVLVLENETLLKPVCVPDMIWSLLLTKTV
jgi:hypothetical protein